MHGFAHNEDAVVVQAPPPGMALVQTVDVLSPLGNNPRLFGRTAAANALSDVYAMGGTPWSAMNIVSYPASSLPLDVLVEILNGGTEALTQAGTVLAGGHTLEDEQIKYGLAVTGIVDPAHIASNTGLLPGDVLILTKPLGTGVLATAIKAGWPGAEEAEDELYRWSTRLNANAGRVLRDMALRAATDVTGFGLGGHALEMAKGSAVSIELDSTAIPFMASVEDFAADGLIPAGTYANRRHCACHTMVLNGVDSLRSTLVFDAQTSGGLLLAVPAARSEEALERLRALDEPGWIVGRVQALREPAEQLIIA